MSYIRQSLWLRSLLYGRRNTLAKEHILPSLRTAATASSTKIHHLQRRFGHLLAEKLYRVLEHQGRWYKWVGRSGHIRLRPVGRPYGSFTARWKAVSRTHGQLKAPFGRQSRRHLRRDFLYISFIFYGSIEATTEAIYRWFHFSSTASVWL